MALTKIVTGGITDDAVTTAKVNPSQTDITAVGTLTSLTVDGAAALKLDANYPTGTGNLGMGNNALNGSISGTYNTAVGDHSMYPLTSGSHNTAFGGSALRFITTGYDNTAMGNEALRDMTTGHTSVAIGYLAQRDMETGNLNSSCGTSSLLVSTTGQQNSTVGHRSLVALTSAVGNSAIGIESGQGITTGSYNTTLGRYAGKNITTGSYNTCIGNDNSVGTATDSFQIVIGHGQVGKGHGTTQIAGPAYQGNNASTWSTTSDIRLKKNIVDNKVGLDAINQVQVKNFEYKTKDEITELPKEQSIDEQGIQLGVIAQEIQSIFPEMVKEETTGVLTVNPDNMTWHLVNAVKELSAKNDELERRLAKLEGK